MSGIEHGDAAATVTRTVADLAAAGREIPVPFRIELERPAGGIGEGLPVGGRVVVDCERVLRLLPGRRLVAEARVAGTPVLLKLFLGAGALRYARREAAGSRRLADAGVPTPRLLGLAATPDGAGQALLFEFLADVRPLEAQDSAGMAAAAAALARLHQAGARHTDLHLENILLPVAPGAGSELRFVDADGIRGRALPGAGRRGLGAAASMRNLALLCAQRPPVCDGDLEAIHRAYLAGRGWATAPAGCGLEDLREAVARERKLRVRRYLRKTGRSCSEFHVEHDRGTTRICVRECWDDAMQRFLRDPEAGFHAGVMLKDGNSATVVRVPIGDRTWIVKRYNVKGFWHRLRRSLKPQTRYRNAWRSGQRLHFLGIPTARPVALLERHRGLVRDVAYLVMEDLGDRDLLGAAQRGPLDDGAIDAVTELFRTLGALGLTHGDTKATNFLLAPARGQSRGQTRGQSWGQSQAPDPNSRAEGQPAEEVALIDLDSMREDARGCARDRERFLENWRDQPALARQFADAFAHAFG